MAQVTSRDRKATRDALSDKPDNLLMCRDVRHQWEWDKTFTQTIGRDGKRLQFRRAIVCQRCGTTRFDTFDKNLDRISSSYDYPENYTVPNNVVRQTGPLVRRIMVERYAPAP